MVGVELVYAHLYTTCIPWEAFSHALADCRVRVLCMQLWLLHRSVHSYQGTASITGTRHLWHTCGDAPAACLSQL